MTSFLDFWGCGKGHLRKLSPAARLVSGAVILGCCLLVPLHKAIGFSLLVLIVMGWQYLSGLPFRIAVKLLIYSSILFLPLFLLVPWISQTEGMNCSWTGALLVPLHIGARGTACIFVCISTIAGLELSEFDHGLVSLHLPQTVVVLISQIIHHTALLSDESQRIGRALRVRNVLSGFVARIWVLHSIPVIWILRNMNRAERVAAAMELRGLELASYSTEQPRWTWQDVLATVLAVLLFTAVLVVRMFL